VPSLSGLGPPLIRQGEGTPFGSEAKPKTQSWEGIMFG
jgi:hypothetical protein